MEFTKLNLHGMLDELVELPSDWMDEAAHALVGQIRASISHFRQLGRSLTTEDLEAALAETPTFLDVCRLFIGQGQEPVAHMICDQLGGPRMTWQRLRRMATREPKAMAAALSAMGVTRMIDEQINRQWEMEDILVERYRMGRGRAIAGQKRGRALEDEVERILEENGAPFEPRVTFVGKRGAQAKCDFAIPEKNHPKIVIEAKGFEATGSKLTDFLGDVLKIGEAKEYHMYFFLVTDGRGWHNRQSDLKNSSTIRTRD
ncbi:MAG: hypothetical protein JW818_07465 [Pirellulales bacterium]|nr:hypothetical protein [Pirellulales bacterium]